MKQLLSVKTSLKRLDQTIALEKNARNRTMLEIYRQHWWGEVTNDMDMILATLPESEVHYRFDGHPFVMGEKREFFTTEEAKALYQSVIDQGDNMAGPFEDERWAFADWGLVFEGILYGIYLGAMFVERMPELDPEQRYLISYRSISMHPMDIEKRLMLGELVYSGSLLSIEPATASIISSVLDF